MDYWPNLQDYLEKGVLPDLEEYLQPTPESRWFSIGESAKNGILDIPNNIEIVGVEEEFLLNIEKIAYKGFMDLLFTQSHEYGLEIRAHKFSSNPDRWRKIPTELSIDSQGLELI